MLSFIIEIFKDHAVGVFEECLQNERCFSRFLLTRVHQQWGDLTAIEIAVNGKSQ